MIQVHAFGQVFQASPGLRRARVHPELRSEQAGLHPTALHPIRAPSAPLPHTALTLALGLARYDALVCTPLRLVSLIEKESLSLHTVSLLVMDEADKLLELGFLEQVRASGCST